MNDRTAKTKLGPALESALKECAECSPHSPYVWKPKSMQKLEAIGLVAKDTLMYRGMVAYSPTEKGREWLASSR